MPGTFSLIAGGCLLARASDLPDSSKFRPELMSQWRCCQWCRFSGVFSEVILFLPNGIMFAWEISVHRQARARVCLCVCTYYATEPLYSWKIIFTHTEKSCSKTWIELSLIVCLSLSNVQGQETTQMLSELLKFLFTLIRTHFCYMKG